MQINQNNIKPLYWLGTTYLLVNAIILIVLTILFFQSQATDSLTNITTILTMPVAGIVSGYWLRLNTISWWKIIIIVLSLFISLAVLFTAIFISPKLDKLKQNKYKQNLKIKTDNQESEKIFHALYSDDIETALQLLKAGVDVSGRNDTGQTLLHAARHPEIIRQLKS